MNSSSSSLELQAAASYDWVARLLHWLTFILVTAEFVVGWCMPEVEWGTEPTGLIGVHLVLGSSLVIVVGLRLVWRFTHRAPRALPSLPQWQRWASSLTHWTLYGLLVAMLLTGWASASARQWPMHAFGFLPLPGLVPADSKIGFQLGDKHADVLSWVLLTVIGVHIAAALYHQFVKRDAVMRRMLVFRTPKQ